MPLIGTHNNSNFFLSLSRLAFAQKPKLTQKEGDADILERLITQCLEEAISNAKYYPVPKSKGSQHPPSGVPKQVRNHIRACLDTKNEALGWSIISKLIDTEGVNAEKAYQRATYVLLPLILYLSGLLHSRSDDAEPLTGIGRLCHAAIAMYLGGGDKVEPTLEVITCLVEAVIMSQDSKILVDV